MRHRHLLVLSLLLPTPLLGQFDVTVRLVEARHSSQASAPDQGDGPSIRPLADLGPGVELGLRRGFWRLAVGASQITHDLVLQGDEGGIVTPGVLRGTNVTAQIGRPIAQHGESHLELAAGVVGTRWSFVGLGDPSRWRWGPVVSLEGVFPLSPRIGMVSRLAASRSGSVFEDDEIPEGYARQGSNRFEWSVGLRIGRR